MLWLPNECVTCYEYIFFYYCWFHGFIVRFKLLFSVSMIFLLWFFFYRVYRRLSIFLRTPRVVVIAVTLLFMYNSVHRNDINTIIFYKTTSSYCENGVYEKKNYIGCIYYEKLYNFIILIRWRLRLKTWFYRKMIRPSFCTDENPYSVYLCKIFPK